MTEQLSTESRKARGETFFFRVGKRSIQAAASTGELFILLGQTFRALATKPLRIDALAEQMYRMGVQSIPLVALTALFTGMVLALQSSYQLKMFSAVNFTADLVALSIFRELGPVLTAMVVAGRVGAGITAELGTMKVTEQLDALKAMATDPVQYLVVPRVVAGFVMLFILAIVADIVGIFGGYIICIFKLGMSDHLYWERTFHAIAERDLWSGLLKSFTLGNNL